MFRRYPPPPCLPRRRPLGQRLLLALARLLVRLLRALARLGWRLRRQLLPAYAALLLVPAAIALHLVADGFATAAALAVVAGGVLGGWTWLRTRRGRRRTPPIRIAYAWSTWAAGSGWVLAVAAWGPTTPWFPGLWLLAAAATTGPWAWHYRIRSTVDTTTTTPQQAIWEEKLSAPGRKLAGTQLINVQPGTGNVEWDAMILGEPGLFTTDTAIQAQPYIASGYQLPAASVVVEPTPDAALHKARLMVVRSNRSHAVAGWDDSWNDPRDGSVPVSLYPDGQRGRVAVWVPGAGTRNSLFSGDSGSGKSRGMTVACLHTTLTGVAVPWFGCPQGGQSSPALAGPDGMADYIARGDDDPTPCLYMLEALRGAMYARSSYLAQLPYLTKGGITRRGVARYDPDLTVLVDDQPVKLGRHMPILDVYIDELPAVLAADPSGKYLLAELVKMVSKTGGRLNVATQMPVLSELGGLDVIRQNLKAGNVISFKNGENTSKGMVLSPWMPSPAHIPDHPPGRDDLHTLGTCVLESVAPGSARATFSRFVWVDDEFDLAERAYRVMPDLDELTARGAGEDYYRQWLATPKGPKVLGAAARRRQQEARQAEPVEQPTRETITVPTAAVGPRAGSLAARAIAYLRQHGGTATTGVIAHALNVPKGQVSQALGREADKTGTVRKVRRGVWGLTDAQAQADADTPGVAA